MSAKSWPSPPEEDGFIVPPPVEDAELDRLMDAFHIAAQRLNVAPELIHNSVTGNALERAYTRAREALRSYLSADTRRMDWLVENCLTISPADTYLRLEYESGLPLRDAIDSAMRERDDG